MNIKKNLEYAFKKISGATIENPNIEAELLLSAVLKKNREYLFSHSKKNISFWQNILFKRLLKKRLTGYSSAVLTGHKWFYGLDFMVNKNVLIPRPETELLVESALEEIFKYQSANINIIDLGTGSGCIAISLVKKILEKNIKFNCYALDISKKALALAKKNSKKHSTTNCINFLYSDLLKVIDFKKINGPIFITANLPYLSPQQIKNSPSIQKEPYLALESGVDGLNHYRRLLQQIKNKQGDIKNKIFIFCEIDESQKNLFLELINKEIPEAKSIIKKDLNYLDRLVIVDIYPDLM